MTNIRPVLIAFVFGLRNRHFVAIDLAAFLFLPVVAMALRMEDADAFVRCAGALAVYVVISSIVRFAVFLPMGLYHRVWRYASVDELAQILFAITASTVVIVVVVWGVLIPWGLLSSLPRSLPLIDVLLILLAVGGSRFSVRLAEHFRQRSERHADACKPVVIFGAGAAGSMIVQEMRCHPRLGLDPVAFLDADPAKAGMVIHGVRVVGGFHRLRDVIALYNVQQAIIAIPSASGKTIRELVQLCADALLPVKTVPGVYELLDGSVTVSKLRSIDIADLLRRTPVAADIAPVQRLLEGKRVLVTGAGGSIGSELCRQIARCNPGMMVLLGHGENSIFDIGNELRRSYPRLKVRNAIADIRDENRLRNVFALARPEIVFHAAAHKHVPLMEQNIQDAITNNVLGTRNVLRVAAQSKVERLVMISSDKAVNPTSVMGSTKRVAELLVHDAAVASGRCFVAVRFGNVLDSRGSVVPFFKKQIAAGGPVTVTHPDVCRYFMTIPEAVELVLQAATLGKPADTFVLDMGEPIRIADLARDIIRLSGLEVGRDIDITYTGLRPGEKLYEELFIPDENCQPTSHPKIMVAHNGDAQAAGAKKNQRVGLESVVDVLIAAAQAGDDEACQRWLTRIIAEHQSALPASAGKPASPAVPLQRTPSAGAITAVPAS